MLRTLLIICMLCCAAGPAWSCMNDSETVIYEQDFQRQYNAPAEPVEPTPEEAFEMPYGIALLAPILAIIGGLITARLVDPARRRA